MGQGQADSERPLKADVRTLDEDVAMALGDFSRGGVCGGSGGCVLSAVSPSPVPRAMLDTEVELICRMNSRPH